MDLRGFGQSAPAEHYDIAAQLADIAGVLDTLGLPRAPLIGHSLGATFLQDFAVTRPDRLAALVLADPTARLLPPPDPVANRVAERLALYGDKAANRAVLEKAVPRY